jgi:hypothetical protein
MAHTFAGTNLRSIIGLDREQLVFKRYRQARRRERNAVGDYFAVAGAAGGTGLVSSMRQDGPPT